MMKHFNINFNSFKFKYVCPPKNQFPTGTRVYCGHQGMGKTLSMVEYAFRIKRQYPKCVIFSNVILCDIEYNLIKTDKDLNFALEYRNGDSGVIILLDEAHLMFGRKTGIPVEVLTAISQQRKDRKRIVFSSQIWEELDISLRKQVPEWVECKRYLGFIQFNTIKDGRELEYNKKKSKYVAPIIGYDIFKHSIELYNKYDTYQKIYTNKDKVDLPVARAPSGLGAAQPQKKSIFKSWS